LEKVISTIENQFKDDLHNSNVDSANWAEQFIEKISKKLLTTREDKLRVDMPNEDIQIIFSKFVRTLEMKPSIKNIKVESKEANK
jgi:hypothetical protein